MPLRSQRRDVVEARRWLVAAAVGTVLPALYTRQGRGWVPLQ